MATDDWQLPDGGSEELSAALTLAEQSVVETSIRGIVEHDPTVLARIGALDFGDPYFWTMGYGEWPQVDLIVPPGEPATWRAYVIRSPDRPGWVAVDCVMWTRQEGRSDLVLQLELSDTLSAQIDVRFVGLLVQ